MEVIVNKQMEIDAMEKLAVASEMDGDNQGDLCMDKHG